MNQLICFFFVCSICLSTQLFGQCNCTTSEVVVTDNTDRISNPPVNSLRWAINCRNAGCPINKITFNLAAGKKEIKLVSQLKITAGNPLTIDATNSGVVIEGSNFLISPWIGVNALEITSSNITIKGLRFANFTGNGPTTREAIEIYTPAGPSTTIEKVEIIGNYFYKFKNGVNGITAGGAKEVMIKKNFFGTKDGESLDSIVGAAGIRITHGSNLTSLPRNYTIDSNTILACNTGVWLAPSGVAQATSTIKIRNNKIGGIDTTKMEKIGIHVEASTADFEIKNNVIEYQKNGILIIQRSGGTITDNTISKNLESGILIDQGASNILINQNNISGNGRFGVELIDFREVI